MPSCCLRIVLFFLCLLPSNAFSQRPEADKGFLANKDSNYIKYLRQLEQLYMTRGATTSEIKTILDQYRALKLESNEQLVEMLSRFYHPSEQVAVLLYFYRDGMLYRNLLEPRRVRHADSLRISTDSLDRLQQELLLAMGVVRSAQSRAPRPRGVLPKPVPRSSLSYDNAVSRWSRILFPPGFSKLYRHLIVIPAHNIGTLPLYVLKPYGDSTILLDRCSYSVAPAVLDIFNRRVKHHDYRDLNVRPEQPMTRSALFVSNPAYPKNGAYIFPNLPGAEAEVTAVRSFSEDAVVLRGADATRQAVIEQMDGKDLVYFATHGIASDTLPMQRSFLVLSGKQPYLTAADIMELRNVNGYRMPKLVVLSACQTGLGRSLDAGVVGLARSFQFVGSGHVLMSLWNVDDAATSYLMQRMMHHLSYSGPARPSEPLRAALLETRSCYPEPKYWASFASFGIDEGLTSPFSVPGFTVQVNSPAAQLRYSPEDSLRIVNRIRPLSNIHVVANRADLQMQRTSDGDVFIDHRGDTFSHSSKLSLEESLILYGRYKYWRELSFRSPGFVASVQVTVITKGDSARYRLDTLKKGFAIPVYEGSIIALHIENPSKNSFYVTIVDVQSNGTIANLNEEGSGGLVVGAQTNELLTDDISVTPPLGHEWLQLIFGLRRQEPSERYMRSTAEEKMNTRFSGIPLTLMWLTGFTSPGAVISIPMVVLK
ncbi:MAG: CHAT domain-containing protein [Chitinophagaceae bacterium]|nr:MAG: CHAT domain-containing protein [Chitinophagaceae bacterium]